ncbi:unnamed protein product [Plutella xylostella]|uniref:(diamondback moth) hypothetical protein n=1 Tax=Plutella xylostella TaxID=51655 RepID=A0A8S4ED26_PLUXY|nr:unnamed protein product [Plutella xylostella]
MEKPDENGFVTVNWPSKNVPHGGVFHHPIVEPSEAKQKLLKVLLNESKLTVAQREKSKWENSLRTEDPPTRRHAESSGAPALVRPRTSRRRSLSTIRESGDYEVEGPLKRGGDREKLKERLQRAMEHGDTDLAPPPPLRKVKAAPALPTKKEMRNDYVWIRSELFAEHPLIWQEKPTPMPNTGEHKHKQANNDKHPSTRQCLLFAVCCLPLFAERVDGNKPRGRPETKVDNEELKAIVEANPSQTTSELAAGSGVSDKTILIHLKQIGKTATKLEELQLECLRHPPYSPDLAPTDYHFFRNLDNYLQGKKFNSDGAVQTAFKDFIDSRPNVLTQIRERAEWLAEMEELGAAAAHRDVVMDQIAERVRGLDALGSRASSARTSVGSVRCREMAFPEPGVRSARERPTMSASTASKSSSNRSSARGRRGQDEDENVSLYSDLPKLRYSARRRC